MFKNPNYEWLLDYEVPQNPTLGGLYWMYMYNKLFSQGTVEDKYELEKLYKESQNNAPFPFNILTGIFFFSNEYKKAVCDFIYNVKMAHYDDEIERDRITETDDLKKKVEEGKRKMSIMTYGYDRKQAQQDAYAVEAELEANHSEEQNKLEFDPDPAKHMHILKYGCGVYMQKNVKVIRKEDIRVETQEGKVEVIHTIMFDKYKGMYNMAVYCEADLDENGKVVVHQAWCDHYADRFIDGFNKNGNKVKVRLAGMDTIYREFIDEFKDKVRFNDYCWYGYTCHGVTNTTDLDERKQGGKVATKNTVAKKAKTVDISKIQKALGIQSSDDELAGDIF